MSIGRDKEWRALTWGISKRCWQGSSSARRKRAEVIGKGRNKGSWWMAGAKSVLAKTKENVTSKGKEERHLGEVCRKRCS